MRGSSKGYIFQFQITRQSRNLFLGSNVIYSSVDPMKRLTMRKDCLDDSTYDRQYSVDQHLIDLGYYSISVQWCQALRENRVP